MALPSRMRRQFSCPAAFPSRTRGFDREREASHLKPSRTRSLCRKHEAQNMPAPICSSRRETRLANAKKEAISRGSSKDERGGSSLPVQRSTTGVKSALVLHHEMFLRYREELNHHEAESRELTEKRDAYKLLSEKLQAELEAARKEHADLVEQVRRVFKVSDDESDKVANGPYPHVQKKLDQIDQLQAEVDAVKAEAEEWKRNMDCLASEKEAALAQLASAEAQLRAAKEMSLAQAKMIEELQSQLNSVVFDRESLDKELEKAKSEAKVVKVDADEMVVVYKADAEVAQVRAKDIIEHAKWQSRREDLEEIHARGVDLSAEIENAKELEAEAKKLAFPEDAESSEDLGESEEDVDPEGDDVAPGED
uniref:Centrosome-associated protein CEP250-like n=1 Tax=Nicotiana tabacum TaxID=4097 RepID=A0A1S4AUY4_TOBAC|nr:PREDICTED: centrosome-associated protein CEP250-like [Nicotiana tabacum]